MYDPQRQRGEEGMDLKEVLQSLIRGDSFSSPVIVRVWIGDDWKDFEIASIGTDYGASVLWTRETKVSTGTAT